jgi:hypothetical protein
MRKTQNPLRDVAQNRLYVYSIRAQSAVYQVAKFNFLKVIKNLNFAIEVPSSRLCNRHLQK